MIQIRRQLVVANSQGLHMRPAAEMARIAMCFSSEIRVVKNEDTADVRSIFELLILGVQHGDALELHAKGHDAHEALEAILAFMNSYRDVEVGHDTAVDGGQDVLVA